MIGERTVEGFEALVIASESGDLDATFVPAAGMVGCSLRHRGEELLGRRRGLRAYATERSTMGIPLLHPWANRLGSERFTVAGRELRLDLDSLPLNRDPAGLPIHGLLAGERGWRVERHEPVSGGALLAAGFDFGADEALLRAFPFAHELRVEARVEGSALTVATTVRASGEQAVPIAFGFHPYLLLPGVDRREWEIEVPVRERLALDASLLPTGERGPASVEPGPLGARTFDDAYVAPPDAAPLALAGGGRRIEVRLGSGYPYTQLYAPADDDVVAFEPMTAPTNALVSGGSVLQVIAPGERYEAEFSIAVSGAERS